MAATEPPQDTLTPLLQVEETLNVTGTVDYKGRPAYRSSTGKWKSAIFLIAAEFAERFAYYGIASNLITYLTGPLGQSTAVAAENVNAWSGTDFLLPFVGAFVADSFLGHFRTILISSLIYLLGLGLLTLSAMLPTSSAYGSQYDYNFKSSPSQFKLILFYFFVYLVAIGLGAQKPSIEAFAADQFDESNAEESKAKSSFFNWWFFGVCSGILIDLLILVYIQDNLS